MALRGRHLLGLIAILLAALAVRATEVYAAQYQTLPVLDWLESRPPLFEADRVPTAPRLVQGLVQTMPLMRVTDDVRPLLPIFGPPAVVQRTIGGVRDAARIQLGTPAVGDVPSVQARLDVIVFNRQVRAAAWSELMASEMDVRDPQNGLFQVRVAGPDELDGVWLAAPREGGGIATVSGRRGAVGFTLQVTCSRLSRRDVVDITARAESIARQAALDWTVWLERELQA